VWSNAHVLRVGYYSYLVFELMRQLLFSMYCRADMSMPSFAEFLKSAVVKAGESARLQCTVDCKPTPAKITWYVRLLVCLQNQQTNNGILKVKLRRVELLVKLHLRATGCHLPYGITQCYLLPDTSEHTPP